LAEKHGGFSDMQRGLGDFESEDPEELEGEEESIRELCAAPCVPTMDKVADTIVGDMLDRLKRDAAREAAVSQDAVRHHVADNRYDVTSYPGSAPVIRDVCHVKKRKVR
jgi:hypothetical protein